MDQPHFERNSLSIGVGDGDGSAVGDRTGFLGTVVPEAEKGEVSLVRIVQPWELQRCTCTEKYRTIQIKDEKLPRCFECLKPRHGNQKENEVEEMMYDQGDEGEVPSGVGPCGTALELESAGDQRETASISQKD